MLAVRKLEEEGRYIFFATRNGTVKKTELKEFSHVRSIGIIAINIEKGDELVAARLTDGQQIVFLASHDGQAIRFDENDVRSMGRNATGVRGMHLDTNDYIVGMATTPKPGAPAPKVEGEVVDVAKKPDSARAMLSKYRLELIAANLIASDSEMVWLLK